MLVHQSPAVAPSRDCPECRKRYERRRRRRSVRDGPRRASKPAALPPPVPAHAPPEPSPAGQDQSRTGSTVITALLIPVIRSTKKSVAVGLVQPDRILHFARKTAASSDNATRRTTPGRETDQYPSWHARSRCAPGSAKAPETTYGTRQRFNSIRVALEHLSF